MAAWYECKITYQKTLEGGKIAKVSETYLVDAVSFTEAETRIFKELGDTLGDLSLVSVKKPKITELVHNEDAYKWYRVKVSIITLNEKTGKESKSAQTILTSASTAKEAFDSVNDLFSDSVSDYEIIEIALLPITDIFPYFDENARKLIPLKEATEEVITEEV